MIESLNFYRGLIIVEPYGTFIRKHQKNIIVKSKVVKSIIKEDLLLIENKKGLGIIILDIPIKINLKEFAKLRKYHKISEADRLDWWPHYKYLYAYPIIETSFFDIPLLLDYPTGPQITVLPKNIFIKKIFIGMSGYYYSNMYPKKTKNLLEYYGDHLNSVEINSTFYKFPGKSTIANLEKSNLNYSIKVNKYITHNKKLGHVKKYWSDFYYSLERIHHQILCFLFQFSSKFYFNDENLSRLYAISKYLSKSHRYAFEFRDIEWFDNPLVTELFNNNGWILVISNLVNVGNWAGNLYDGYNPLIKNYQITSDSVYFRMHGTVSKYRGSYTDSELRNIFNFISKTPIKFAFIYFNNTDSDADAFNDAIHLRSKFNPVNDES
jgi:uncharacterized protein YecE (DUF72 family)